MSVEYIGEAVIEKVIQRNAKDLGNITPLDLMKMVKTDLGNIKGLKFKSAESILEKAKDKITKIYTSQFYVPPVEADEDYIKSLEFKTRQ